jgi:hypothetical protein
VHLLVAAALRRKDGVFAKVVAVAEPNAFEKNLDFDLPDSSISAR